MFSSPRLALTRGAARDRHGRGARDAVGVLGCSASVARTNNSIRTAKSCGPGAPTLALSLWSRLTRATVANKPGTPGTTTYKPFNHCAGKAGYAADLWFCRVLFCCTRTMGISRYPAFPAPSVVTRVIHWQSSGASAPRDCGSVATALVAGA